MRLDFPELGPLRIDRIRQIPEPSTDLWAGLGRLRGLAILDSAAGGRYTIVAALPQVRLRWRPDGAEVALPGGARVRDASFPHMLRACLEKTKIESPHPLPYGPGWLGFFGYGLRAAFESVPEQHADETGLPDVQLAYYPAVAVHDAKERRWSMLYRESAADAARSIHACLKTRAERRPFRLASAPQPQVTRETYLAAVKRAVEYIYAGDVFQVNYAHEFRAGFAGDALGLYLALRDSNPAPYGAFLDLGRGDAVLSTSPELFLSLQGDRVRTRPIKGTAPRHDDAGEDAAERTRLLKSEKDAAELAMIVDLERNDLGRVCRPGTVRVDEAAVIESYTSVHHRVAEVSGTLEAGADRLDLLAASFPGGSITGAPKIRAMEIIDELEVSRRGPYTGSIGILTDEGSMELNIAIRTAVLARDVVRIHVGGGIVADSDPVAEYEETLDKGRAMFRALEP